ncbi:type II toxin-antitoxin system HicA family toxin [Litorisediminicola beolgyonensis]|uniref:Type II toxin-antitoxin system HicA family toxin n=1 Tax=Litorisediminicola beolgyonensis TaxID=1173614 RepID=A0ABW3ZCA2_9RHOB
MASLYRRVSEQLRIAGFQKIAGGKGSHEKWRHEYSGRLVIVPRNLKSRHTADGILKSAGLEKLR